MSTTSELMCVVFYIQGLIKEFEKISSIDDDYSEYSEELEYYRDVVLSAVSQTELDFERKDPAPGYRCAEYLQKAAGAFNDKELVIRIINSIMEAEQIITEYYLDKI